VLLLAQEGKYAEQDVNFYDTFVIYFLYRFRNWKLYILYCTSCKRKGIYFCCTMINKFMVVIILSICVNQIQCTRVRREQIVGRESDTGDKLAACVGYAFI
jgi:hypothetical protein